MTIEPSGRYAYVALAKPELTGNILAYAIASDGSLQRLPDAASASGFHAVVAGSRSVGPLPVRAHRDRQHGAAIRHRRTLVPWSGRWRPNRTRRGSR
jgi:hypothetical protein